ncbi:hypothetical protein VTI74DRAFT_7481 [Chaetomium olivicolor]
MEQNARDPTDTGKRILFTERVKFFKVRFETPFRVHHFHITWPRDRGGIGNPTFPARPRTNRDSRRTCVLPKRMDGMGKLLRRQLC